MLKKKLRESLIASIASNNELRPHDKSGPPLACSIAVSECRDVAPVLAKSPYLQSRARRLTIRVEPEVHLGILHALKLQ
jgi:hypothetical protein